MLSAMLDKELRKTYKKRSLPLRKGDEVVIMRGSHKGKLGKITDVDMKRMKIYVDNAKIKKASGQEVRASVDPSNLKIIKLNIDDKKRMKFMERKSG